MTTCPDRRACLLGGILGLLSLSAVSAEQRRVIPPQATDPRLSADDAPHLVIDGGDGADAPLLVWLGGTNGTPERGPRGFYEAARREGYRLLAVSYLDTQAVAGVCVGATLRARPACAGQMRQHRVWGEPLTDLIADRPEDAIVPRLTALLRHLARTEPAGRWEQYLDGAEPRWPRVVLAGQSQGGGMSAYIAQTRRVAGVIVFSGGWDRRPGGDIADWYGRPSETPPQRWHATFHAQEPQAATLERTYQRLGVPPAQIHRLDEPVQGSMAHTEGIRNPAYRALWEEMLRATR
jgi:hypothetical protein